MLEYLLLYNVRLEHPGVKTTCIYSVGVPTPVGLEYSDGFPDTQPTRLDLFLIKSLLSEIFENPFVSIFRKKVRKFRFRF